MVEIYIKEQTNIFWNKNIYDFCFTTLDNKTVTINLNGSSLCNNNENDLILNRKQGTEFQILEY